MDQEPSITIERIGGFGGFGLPGSHLKSKGELPESELSPEDRQGIEALFRPGAKRAPETRSMDGFRYRITRMINSKPQTIEVPEESVPMALRNSVKDTLE